MKVLITGVNGFVGSALARVLVSRGHQVRGIARTTAAGGNLEESGVEMLAGDIRDRALVNKALSDREVVYHIAAKTTKHALSRKEYYVHNVEATRMIAQSALAAGVRRFFYAGSVGVYGTNRNHAIDETTRPAPDSYYRQSKLAAEQEVLRMHRENGLPAVVGRLGTTFGPGSLNLLEVSRKMQGGVFRVIGRGRNYNHHAYIDDVVEGIVRCGETPGIEGKTYILSAAKPASLAEVLRILARESHGGIELSRLPLFAIELYHQVCALIFRLCAIQLPRARYYDLFLIDHIYRTTAAQDELGYCPGVSLEEGIVRMVQWYRERGLLRG